MINWKREAIELRHRKPVSYELKPRTFEGKTDPSKNGDPLTSKYMTSYKYWMKVYYEEGEPTTHTFPGKQNALAYYKELADKAGQIM